jgi:5-methylcytosine-specific restriction enzyme A
MANVVKRNPTWTRDELILALAVYFELDPLRMIPQEPKIIELSNLLNELPIYDQRLHNIKFRNPAGVSMKLRNLLRFDPTYPGSRLGRGGRLEEEVWNEFAADRTRLRNTARAIRENYRTLTQRRWPDDRWDDDEESCSEGAILLRVHQLRERNQALVKKKKEEVLREIGLLACQVCTFDFNRTYGELGYGFAECHHIVPLSSLTYAGVTSLADLAIVCANCHRMLHRSRAWLSVAELRFRITSSSKKEGEDA